MRCSLTLTFEKKIRNGSLAQFVSRIELHSSESSAPFVILAIERKISAIKVSSGKLKFHFKRHVSHSQEIPKETDKTYRSVRTIYARTLNLANKHRFILLLNENPSQQADGIKQVCLSLSACPKQVK